MIIINGEMDEISFKSPSLHRIMFTSLWRPQLQKNMFPNMSPLQHLCWVFGTNWKHFYFVDHMTMSTHDYCFIVLFYFFIF